MADDDRTALLDGIEADLAGVEQALARLDGGSYFTCEVCGTVLDDAVLAVTPLVARCGSCAALSANAPVTAPETVVDVTGEAAADDGVDPTPASPDDVA